ncbi:NAD-dependent epimerase/dehydratase family protein [Mycoplasmatota bacterium]|nr:NAD-dependent epimerase/dehydratase family protein [Mycoplasmatota bacterium]
MKILVLGGTRFVGIHLVNELLKKSYDITIANRGTTKDEFGHEVKRIVFDRYDSKSIKDKLTDQYDVIYDTLAYASNDVKVLLDNIKCNKYIMVSSAAVYEDYINVSEDKFQPEKNKLIWCNRGDYSYSKIKRQAETAIYQEYSSVNAITVRYPFVVGNDDYTNRLKFYVEHIINGLPMYIDNLNDQLCFISSNECGNALAELASKNYVGPLNFSNSGAISIKEIINYIERKTGKIAEYAKNGDAGPYNGKYVSSLNLSECNKLNIDFSDVREWIFNLLDEIIEEVI